MLSSAENGSFVGSDGRVRVERENVWMDDYNNLTSTVNTAPLSFNVNFVSSKARKK